MSIRRASDRVRLSNPIIFIMVGTIVGALVLIGIILVGA
jgi:hypothetical protein